MASTPEATAEKIRLARDVVALSASIISTLYLLELVTDGGVSSTAKALWAYAKQEVKRLQWYSNLQAWAVYWAEEALTEGNSEPTD